MKLPFNVDLKNKIIAITGAGGVLMSEFAKALAECGAKVALLDINYDAAKKYADFTLEVRILLLIIRDDRADG